MAQTPDQQLGTAQQGAYAPRQNAPIAAQGGVAAAAARAESERKKKRRRAVVIVIILLLLALVGGAAAYSVMNQPEDLYDTSALEGIAPNKSAAEIQAELNRVVDESMFDISIASVIAFTDDGKEGTAYIENVPGNHYDLQVSIVPEGQTDPIYESKLLAPGNYIEKISIDPPLDTGNHKAIAHFKALDTESHEQIGAVDAEVVLAVGTVEAEGGDE